MENTNKEKLIQLFNLCINDDKKHSSNSIDASNSGSSLYYNWDYHCNPNCKTKKILKYSTNFENTQANVSYEDRNKAVAQHNLQYVYNYEEPEAGLTPENWTNITINFDDLPPLALIAAAKTELVVESKQTYKTKINWFKRKNLEFTKKEYVHNYYFTLSQGTVSAELTLAEGVELINNYNKALEKADLNKLDERIKGYNSKE